MTTVEQTNPNSQAYLPTEAQNLLVDRYLLDQRHTLSGLPEVRNQKVLASNIYGLGIDLGRIGTVVRNIGGKDVRVGSSVEADGLIVQLKTSDEAGQTIFGFNHTQIDPTVSFQEPGKEAHEIPFALVPQSHWKIMGNVREEIDNIERNGGSKGGKRERLSRVSSIIGSLVSSRKKNVRIGSFH